MGVLNPNARKCVVHYQRKKRKGLNFSLESIFLDVRERLSGKLKIGLTNAPFHSNGFFRRLWIVVDSNLNSADVLHVTGDINFAAIKLRKCKRVLTVLDCGFMQRKNRLARILLKLFWLSLPIRHADVVTTISEFCKLEIINHTGCSPSKIRIVYPAISEKFSFSPKIFEKKRPRILMIGSAENKNIVRMLTACIGLECELTIIGNLSIAAKTLIAENGLRVTNLQGLSNDEVHEQYLICDILLFASTFEGFGMPILEAQAVGRPVVSSNVTAMPEVAGNGAILVDPYDIQSIRNAVTTIIECDSIRDNLVRHGLENVRRFRAQTIAEEYLAIYESLLGRSFGVPAHTKMCATNEPQQFCS